MGSHQMHLGFRAYARVNVLSAGWMGSNTEDVEVGTSIFNLLVFFFFFLECMMKGVGEVNPTDFR